MTSIVSTTIPTTAPTSTAPQTSAPAQQQGGGANATSEQSSTNTANTSNVSNDGNTANTAQNSGSSSSSTTPSSSQSPSSPQTTSTTTGTQATTQAGQATQAQQAQAGQTQTAAQAQTPQAPAPAAHVAVNFAMAAEEIHADFKSALMQSLPPEILAQILDDAGEVDVELINLLAKIDKAFLNKNLAINPAAPGELDKIDQWLRLIIGNPKLADDLIDRVPLSSAKEIAQLIDKLLSLVGERGTPLKNAMAQLDAKNNRALNNMGVVGGAGGANNANVSPAMARASNAQSTANALSAGNTNNASNTTNTNVAKTTAPATSAINTTNTNIANNTNTARNVNNTNVATNSAVNAQSAPTSAQSPMSPQTTQRTSTTTTTTTQNTTAPAPAPQTQSANFAQQNINTNINTNVNRNASANTNSNNIIADMSRNTFNNAPSALIDIAKDSNNFAGIDKKLDSAVAQKIVADIQRMLPTPEKESVVKVVHDPKTLLPQSARSDITPTTPSSAPQDLSMSTAVKDVRSENINLLDRSVNTLLGNNDANRATITPLRESVDSLSKLVANVAKIPVDQTNTNRAAPSNANVANVNVANNTAEATRLINTLSNNLSAAQNRIDQNGSLNTTEKLNLFTQVRDTVAKLDDAMRPLAREVQPMPKSFFDRVIASSDFKISDQTKNNVFSRIDNAQNILRQLPADMQTSSSRNAMPMPPSSSSSMTPTTSTTTMTTTLPPTAQTSSTQTQMPSQSQSSLSNNIEKIGNNAPAQSILDSVQKLWSASEHIRMGFREAFSSLDLESRVSPMSAREGSVAHVIKQNADALRMSILLEVSGALREIGASTEELRNIIAQLLSKTDLGKVLQDELAKAIRVLEQEARNGSAEITEKLKDILKELSRLQTELARSEQSALTRGSSPADIIRSTALTLARGLESLSLLAAQTRGMETQQQLIALPVKMGQEWTEVHIKFVKENKSKDGKDNGHVSIYVNTEPSALGALTAHFDYNPPSLLKLSINFEKAEATKWFKDHAAELRETLAGAGFQGLSFDFRTKPPAKKIDKVDRATLDNYVIKDDKVDVKI